MSNNAQYLKQLVEGGTTIKDLPEPKSIIGGYLYQLCKSGMGAPTDAQVKAAIDELAETHPELFSGLTEDEVEEMINSVKSEFVTPSNLKTVNGNSLIGSGDIHIEGGESSIDELDFIEPKYVFPDFETEWISGKYVSRTGELISNDDSKYCEFTVVSGEKYLLTTRYYSNTRGYAFYDNDGQVLSIYPNATGGVPMTLETLQVTVPYNATKMRVSAYQLTNPSVKKAIIDRYDIKDNGIEYTKIDKRLTDSFELNFEKEIEYSEQSNGYLNVTNGFSEMDSTSYNHVTFDVKSGEKYRVIGTPYYQAVLYGFVDENGTKFGAYPSVNSGNNSTVYDVVVTVPANATKMIVNTKLIGTRFGKVFEVSSMHEKSNDVLYGKKWCVCGDSFTEGDFSGYTDADGKSGTESDAYDKLVGHYKTYPYWIGKRNYMNVQWLAKSGSDFTNVSGATNPFSDTSTSGHNYSLIANDCDYVTFMFGLNESGLTNAEIGTKDSTDNTTLWGAYKTVLLDVVNKNPTVKIGIIISDAWLSQTYHDALIEIAKYFGIPYLDLRDGETVPMQIGGKLSSYSTDMKALRDSAFKVSSSNGHPNVKAHQYRSTTIENFLRSI